jgi:uncharacterized protein (TIGR03435 family)
VRQAAITALLILSAAAQTQFEVASIKPSRPVSGPIRVGSRGGPGTSDPSLFTCENCGMAMLLRQAFDLRDYQLAEQVWMRSERFNVSAKIPEGATREQFRLMMQDLLTERLKLKFHYEKKEMQVYELVALKSGPKLKESAGPSDSAQPAGFTVDADGFPILPLSRELAYIKTADGHSAMREAEMTMDELAVLFSQQLGRPVTDATGLKGKYDFALKWIEQTAGAPATDDSGPNMLRAVQEQLGLKLESRKGLVDVLVVDHVEKIPTEN